MKTKFNGILTLFLAFVVQFTFAQQKTISGSVKEGSDGLPGVSVLVKGTSSGTETDFEGRYTISAKIGDVLVFSYLGYKTVEKKVGSANVINVSMKEDSSVLDEIVVTGYTRQKKSEITGSAVKVSAETLKDVVTPTVDQALQGKVAGLTITAASGTPGSTSNIRIRGISSINAGNEPLYVIDGVPVSNGNVSSSGATSFLSALSAFDSNNIESITVLKDAAATSQYGARGSNGVILITTKSGKKGKTRFTFSSTYGVQNDAIAPPAILTAADRLELASESYFNDGFFGSKADAEAFLLGGAFKAWDDNGRPEANWDQVITNKDAPLEQYNLSATGGGDDYTFYASLGYLYQEATVIGSDFDRISGTLNFSKDLTEKLKFTSNNSAAHTTQNSYLERSAYFESPRTVRFFLSPLTFPYNDDGTPSAFGGSLPNPLILVRDNINKNLFTRIVSNNSLNYSISDNLSVGSRVNVDYQIYRSQFYGNRNYGYSAPNGGEASQSFRNNVFYVLQNYVDYTLNLNENHAFDFKLLQEYQTNRSYFLSADGQNFADDGLVNLASAGTPTSITSSYSDFHVAAFLGLVHYAAYDGKYVADFSYRREGNSRFASAKRWGDFWSVGGAWNIHKESFLEDSKVFSNLKLRTSYGKTGNANINLNLYQSLFSFSVDYGAEGAQQVSTFGNKDLSWETSTTFDIGLEYGLFDNRLTGSVGYFFRESNDLLLAVPLSQTTGFTSQTRNIGSLENSGIEFDFNYDVVRSDDFNFSIGGNFATVENVVTKLPLDPNGIERTVTTTISRIETGNPVRGWYMPTWAGVNPDTGEEEWYINGVDGDRTNNFNQAQAVWQGANGVPTFTAGLNLNLRYKGLYLNASGYYAAGNKIYEGWHRYLNQTNGFPTFAFNGLRAIMDRWQQPGDMVRYGKATSSFTPWQRHSKFLYDGDFFRLRSVTFGYNLPNSLTEKLGITGLNLFVKGNNLYTWVKDKNLLYDPEVDLGGQTGLETPPTQSVSLGLTLNF